MEKIEIGHEKKIIFNERICTVCLASIDGRGFCTANCKWDRDYGRMRPTKTRKWLRVETLVEEF